jgi:hypothetical protein
MFSLVSLEGSEFHTQPLAGSAATSLPEAWQFLQLISSLTARGIFAVASVLPLLSLATIFTIE